MEKALIEQSRIVLGRRGGSTATPRTALLVLLAASAIVGMVLLCFANWQ